jgi:hypothetical protein
MAQMSAAATRYDRMQDLPAGSILADKEINSTNSSQLFADFPEQPFFSDEIPNRKFLWIIVKASSN